MANHTTGKVKGASWRGGAMIRQRKILNRPCIECGHGWIAHSKAIGCYGRCDDGFICACPKYVAPKTEEKG